MSYCDIHHLFNYIIVKTLSANNLNLDVLLENKGNKTIVLLYLEVKQKKNIYNP